MLEITKVKIRMTNIIENLGKFFMIIDKDMGAARYYDMDEFPDDRQLLFHADYSFTDSFVLFGFEKDSDKTILLAYCDNQKNYLEYNRRYDYIIFRKEKPLNPVCIELVENFESVDNDRRNMFYIYCEDVYFNLSTYGAYYMFSKALDKKEDATEIMFTGRLIININ